MKTNDGPVPKNRNRNYDETHQQLIEKAGELIAESGADGVSISALARVSGINRSTVYYHFDSREALMSAAQQWSREQQASADPAMSHWVGIDNIAGLFQRDPDVITSWIDDYLVAGDVRERYPHWDRLVAQIGDTFAELAAEDPNDAEIFGALMLSSALVVPRKQNYAVHPFESLERILSRIHANATHADNDRKTVWRNGSAN